VHAIAMDYPRSETETFTEMGTNRWMSRPDMIQLVSRIVKNGGYYRRTGDSTTFEIRKQVDADTISLDMTVLPSTVLVSGKIQPGMDRLFDKESWDAMKHMKPTDPENFEHFLVPLPRHVAVMWGGGYEPHFEFYAADRVMLAAFVLRIFKVGV
jgi:hypothetical protein